MSPTATNRLNPAQPSLNRANLRHPTRAKLQERLVDDAVEPERGSASSQPLSATARKQTLLRNLHPDTPFKPDVARADDVRLDLERGELTLVFGGSNCLYGLREGSGGFLLIDYPGDHDSPEPAPEVA